MNKPEGYSKDSRPASRNSFLKELTNFSRLLLREYSLNSIFVFYPQITLVIVGLVTLPIILANLPIEDYGNLQFVLALQVVFIALTGGNITAGAKRGIAKGLDGTFLFAFLSRLRIMTAVSLLGFITSFFLYINGWQTISLLLAISSAYLLLGYLFQISYQQYFIAKKQFKQLAIWEVTSSVSMAAAITVSAYLTHNILIFAAVQFGWMTVTGWLGWLYVVRKNGLIAAYKKELTDGECVPYGRKLIPADLIVLIAYRISHYIIGPVFGYSNLAVFSVAFNLNSRIAGFMKEARPLLYSDFALLEEEKLIKAATHRLKYGIVISLAITLVFVVAGYLYISLFLPAIYQMALTYFFILALALPSILIGITLQVMLEVNFRYRELTILATVPSLIKIALIIGLGLSFGVIGICWGIAIGAWIRFAFYYLITLKRETVRQYLNRFFAREEAPKEF